MRLLRSTGLAWQFVGMFTSLPVKQEQFLFLVVEGMPGSHAYAKVYGESLSKKVCEASASRLLARAKVQQRRNEMIVAKAAEQPITTTYLTRELLAVGLEARKIGQGSAAVAAYQTVAKLHGLLIDKVQVDALVRKPTESPDAPIEMSEEDWLTKYGVVNLIAEPLQPIDESPKEEIIPTDQGSEPIVEG